MTLFLPGFLVLCASVLAGLGLSLALKDVRQRRHDVERHVSLVTSGQGRSLGSGAAVTTESSKSSWSNVLGTRLRGLCAVGLARTWGMSAGALALILTGAAGAGLTWLVVHSGLHLSNWISLAGTATGLFLAPRALLKRQQSRTERRFMEVFPDAIDMVIRMLRAGLPITGAVRAVGHEASPPVNEVFTNIADKMSIGIPFEDALAAAGQHIGIADFQFFATAISLQRATGGNLTATLDILSDLMRKRQAMRLKAKATTGEVRMSAYVLGAMPFLIIVGLLILTPDYLQPLIADRRGNAIIAAAILSMLTGFAVIRQMMRGVTRAS